MRVGWFREYGVEIQRRSRDRLQLLGNSDREIREVDILVLGGGEVGAGTSEESLHLETPHLTSSTIPEDESANVDDTLAIDKELEFTIGCANVVEPDALRDSSPSTAGEGERTTANRCTISGVAVRLGFDVANFLVGVERRGEVGVEFTRALTTPHETSREAGAGATASGTANSFVITVTTINAGELATLLEFKSFGEIDRVTKSGLLSRGEINTVRTRGVERETALWFMTEVERALGVVSLHRLLAIGSGCVSVRKTLKNSGGAESGVSESKSIGRGAGSPGIEATAGREELAKQSTEDITRAGAS